MVLVIGVRGGGGRCAVMLWSIVRAILRSPETLGRYLRKRRGVRGYLRGVAAA